MKQDTALIAWAAGLFEGEGSVISVKNGKNCSLSLAMSDEDIMLKFVDVMERGKVHGPYQYKNGKPMWYWKVTGKDFTEQVFSTFRPYLGSRRTLKFQEVIDLWYSNPTKRIPTRRNTIAR